MMLIGRETKLDRVEEVLDRFADRVFAFDEFGPLVIRPKTPRLTAGHLSPYPRGAVQPAQKGGRQLTGRPEVDSCRPARRRPPST